ncbi:hypothetical protein [Sphingobacterium sp. IITKGP-BTPF85]|uniref:hypothetical protein n=1 Tax=Sphingobacterium sp. IITKGP-BTPF85 TaxID=1338009 RepID=UPI000389E060|nr:hypothetical protein [Sphingobacterium sp. IITKGP-BTPF85]KKX46646.1 hypothetical protein L950_0230755 [Sphingobacterium sp. IITKGP-BTPF85]
MDYIIDELNLNNKLEELSLSLPSTISFFPENLETVEAKEKFIFTESMVDLNKVFRQSNITLEVLGGDTELYRSRKNADIYLPAVFFSLSMISENPNLVSVSLNVLSSYVYDRLKGSFGKKTAHAEFYIETKEKGKIKKVSYKGEASGIKDLEKVIKALK